MVRGSNLKFFLMTRYNDNVTIVNRFIDMKMVMKPFANEALTTRLGRW